MAFGFGTPNVEKMEKKKDVKGLIEALEYKKSDYVRADAAYALGRIGDPKAVEPLLEELIVRKYSYVPTNVRDAAAWALAKIGEPAVVPLIRALEHSEVCTPLIEIGQPAVEPLIESLGGSRNMGENAARALGQIGDQRAVEPLLRAPNFSSVHIRALATIGDIRAAESLVAMADVDAYPDITSPKQGAVAHAAAIKIVGSSVTQLVPALSNTNSQMRAKAAKILDEVGWKPSKDEAGAAYWAAKEDWDKCVEIGKPAIAPLIRSLDSCAAAVYPLIKIGKPAVEPLVTALNETNENVRARAAEALGAIGDTRATDPLLKALHDEDDFVSGMASKALDKLGWVASDAETAAVSLVAKEQWDKCIQMGKSAIEPLVKVLYNRYGDVNLEAAIALSELGDVRAVEPLLSKLKDPRNGGFSSIAFSRLKERKKAAQALVRLYRDNRINESAKQAILANRDAITAPHVDDIQYRESCGERDERHTDTGIGERFPF